MAGKTKYYTVDEVAGYAGISTQAIYKAIKAGKFPTSIHYPRHHMLSHADVENFLEERGLRLENDVREQGR